MNIKQELVRWFSDTYETEKEAQEAHVWKFFNPAAVFKTGTGYVLGLMRNDEWPPHRAAKEIQNLTGFELVSVCSPLFEIWVPYSESMK